MKSAGMVIASVPAGVVSVNGNQNLAATTTNNAIQYNGLPVTEIKQEKATGVEIYPNPVTNQLNISSSEIISKIYIYNITGLLLKIYNPASNQTVINFSGLSNGIYLVKISSVDGSVVMKKIIKE